jgi:Glycosyl hydrolase catalytic core/F5/8 type C domain
MWKTPITAMILAITLTACGGGAPGELPLDDTQAELTGCASNALALAGATASSTRSGTSNTPAKAIDQSTTSRWESTIGVDPQWIQVDLGARKMVSRIVIRWAMSANAKDYQIQISDDGTTFRTILSKTGLAATRDRVDDWSESTGITAAAGRYVRVYGTARNANYGYSIWEIGAYGDANPSCASAVDPGTGGTGGAGGATGTPGTGGTTETGGSTSCPSSPLALSSAAASSVEAAYTANLAIDGNATTRWSSAFSDPQWVSASLGGIRYINRVVLSWEAAFSSDYDIQVSSDNANWTTVFKNCLGKGGTEDISFAWTQAQYLRIYSRARATAWGNSLFEIKAFGSTSTTCTPPANPTLTPAPNCTAPVPSNDGCKRGVSFNGVSTADMQKLQPSVVWWYNWTYSQSLSYAGVEYAPMIWGGKGWTNWSASTVEPKIPASSTFLLGFNEPNFTSQSNLTPSTAAGLWPEVVQIATDKNLKIVSPAMNYCPSGGCTTVPGTGINVSDPTAWLDQFFAGCPGGCKVDAIAVHWYNCDLPSLQSYIAKFAKYGKPIWLTEFACAYGGGDTSAAGQLKYMNAAVPWLESAASVQRYAWFMGRGGINNGASALIDSAGSLTALGTAYRNLARNAACNR